MVFDFQDGGHPLFWIVKSSNFNGRQSGEGLCASSCQIWWQSVTPLRHVAVFRFSRCRRHLGFLNFRNFNGENAQEAQSASPWQISWRSIKRLLRYGDFSIFPIWRLFAILDLLCAYLEYRRRRLVVFIIVQNLVGIDAVVSMICMHAFHFASFAWKCLFTPPELFFSGGGGFDPYIGNHINETHKSTSLRESAEPSCEKIRQGLWPVGEFPN